MPQTPDLERPATTPGSLPLPRWGLDLGRPATILSGWPGDPESSASGAILFALLHLSAALSMGLAQLAFLPSALGTGAVPALPGAVAAMALAVTLLPWRAWPSRSSAALIPGVAALLGLHAQFGEAEPALHAIFALVGFAWLGLVHPRGTSLWIVAPAAVLYGIPGLVMGARSGLPWAPMACTAVTGILVAETLAWIAGHARGEQKRLRQACVGLRHREARFRALVQSSSDVISIIEADGRIRYQGGAIRSAFGYAATELLETRLDEWAHPDDEPRVRMFLRELLRQPERSLTFEFRLRHATAGWRHCSTSGANLIHDEHVQGLVLNTRDITDRKRLEEELGHQAFHDSLTGLANRALFANRVEQALAHAQRIGAPVTVLFLDLDGFKTINDSLGHATGDELLVDVASRLRACLRPGDTAARLGGDEFAVLLENLTVMADATQVAERILGCLQAPFMLQDKPVVVRGSLGIASNATGFEGASDLLRNADVAMYVAKANGKSRYAVFEQHMHADVLARLELETDLHRAIDAEQFRVHYQPVVDLTTGRITGMEALLRWQHPERGLVHPAEFIPLLEETGLIHRLGLWVLHQACRETRAWQAMHPSSPPLTVGVNLSGCQLQRPELVGEVAEALRASGLPPESLILEITESVLLDDTGATIAMINRLKELGVRLALDDFGTGYGSLSYIQRFHIDFLKVDRSFLRSEGNGAEDLALLRAVIELGRSLSLKTIAEGIENAQQLELLKSLGCHFAQGYYFAGPLEAEDMEALLRNARPEAQGWVVSSERRILGSLWETFSQTGTGG